jgi:toxin FitB
MYLIDTNIISEFRKKARAHPGVISLFRDIQETGQNVYLSSITIGELQRGIALCRDRADIQQAQLLEQWLDSVVSNFDGNILSFCTDCARVWGHLCDPDNTNVLDKQLAATALVYDLTLVTRNVRHVESTGVKVLNPFSWHGGITA